MKPRAAVQPGLDVVREERPQHQDSPEPEHDARNRSEQLDERADDATHASGRQLAEIEADRDRERRREHERDERAHRRPVDEGQRAEDVLDRVPGRAVMNPRPKRSKASLESRRTFQTIAPTSVTHARAAAAGQAVQREVTDTSAEPAAGLERARRGRRSSRASVLSGRGCEALVHHLVTSLQPPFSPAWEEDGHPRRDMNETRGAIVTRRTIAVLAALGAALSFDGRSRGPARRRFTDRSGQLVRGAARVGVDPEGRCGVRRQGDVRADRIRRRHQRDHEPNRRFRSQRRTADAGPVRRLQGLRPDPLGSLGHIARLSR